MSTSDNDQNNLSQRGGGAEREREFIRNEIPSKGGEGILFKAQSVNKVRRRKQLALTKHAGCR
jgi:hypothetical protein